MDYDVLAAQLLRALRGRRSQKAFSKRLGYASNVAYPWESGRRFPTAAETFRVAARMGIDVHAAVAPFFQRQLPDELRDADPTEPAFVAALLRVARGKIPMRLLATRIDQSRSAVSRMLSGESEPRLPVFLRLVDASTRRVLDLLAGFVDVAALPAAKSEWERIEALRRLAYENPLSEAVPRFIELEQYEALPRHRPGWIAERLRISRADEERTLADLATAGVIAFDRSHWKVDQTRSVDTSRDPRGSSRLVHHWTRLASERIAAGLDGKFSYLVFGTDDETLAAIQELRLRYVRELRTLVRKAPTATRVMVANMHLFPIDDGGAPAPASSASPTEGRPTGSPGSPRALPAAAPRRGR